MTDFEFTYDESLGIFFALRDRRHQIMKQIDDGLIGINKHTELKTSFEHSLSVLDKLQKAFDSCKESGNKTCSFELHPFKTCMKVSMEDF